MHATESNAPLKAAPAPGPNEPALTLRGLAGSAEWRIGEPSPEETQEISNALRQRRRWRDVPATAARVTRLCCEVMARLGVSDDMLREMAQVRAIEIDLLPAQATALSFPWEFVIAEATRLHRHSSGPLGEPRRSLLITRHLLAGTTKPLAKPDSVLVIESAPGELGEHFSFRSERSIVLSSLKMPLSRELKNPDTNELRNVIVAMNPSVIHFTGVDSVQAAELLELDLWKSQGVLLYEDREFLNVGSAQMAGLLTSAERRPALVAFNFYNSSSFAQLVVERGAHAAIGFQDDIDDAVAEVFFAALYTSWQPSWNLFEAFDRAWRRLGSHALEIRGTGITVWTRQSIRDKPTWVEPAAAPATGPAPAKRRRAKQTPEVDLPPVAPAPPEPAAPVTAPGDPITIEYEPLDKLNYSLLHNNLPLFRKFMLRCSVQDKQSVSVAVALNAGIETARYEASFNLSSTNNAVNLASPDNKDSIRVSLTSELARSLAESVYTSVVVHVQHNGKTLRQQTHRVELLAIDEWKDDDLNRQWLPSFVFPRDIAIRRIVDAAQRYLVALADNSGAGFDGYQSYDPDGASLEERAQGIDFQVQAIWWAIISDFNLSYINPPPTFTDKSQRLRTPFDIVDGKRGTCIDLTLLLAACLEYVDIYPVIFLLRDHAFPGYVRSESSHDLIRDYFRTTTTAAEPTGPRSERSSAQYGWVLPSSRFAEVMKLVQGGQIVPIETVALTQRAAFKDAVAEGLQNLRDRRNFESLFDIRLAREASVTPLPLWSGRL